MQDRKTQFQTFSDARLIEIVKNARQFGYDDTIQAIALEVLKERGISEADLQLTGNLSNYRFDRAEELYRSHSLFSKIAFFLYLLLLVLKGIDAFHLFGLDTGMTLTLLYWVALVGYFAVLLKSFIDHVNFYKSIGKELGVGDQFIYLFIGMPFYIFMYFFYKSRMKEEMLMVK